MDKNILKADDILKSVRYRVKNKHIPNIYENTGQECEWKYIEDVFYWYGPYHTDHEQFWSFTVFHFSKYFF